MVHFFWSVGPVRSEEYTHLNNGCLKQLLPMGYKYIGHQHYHITLLALHVRGNKAVNVSFPFNTLCMWSIGNSPYNTYMLRVPRHSN